METNHFDAWLKYRYPREQIDLYYPPSVWRKNSLYKLSEDSHLFEAEKNTLNVRGTIHDSCTINLKDNTTIELNCNGIRRSLVEVSNVIIACTTGIGCKVIIKWGSTAKIYYSHPYTERKFKFHRNHG